MSTKAAVSLELHIKGTQYLERHTCVVTELGFCDVILGKPWLAKHNPRIDWKLNTVELPNGEVVHGST